MTKLKRSEYILKIISNAVLVIFFSMVQTNLLVSLRWPWNFFNLILSIVIFITVILNYHRGLWFALFSGLIIDLFSFLPFGTMTAAMLLTVIIINGLFKNFFTNRSLYSLIILGFLGNIVYFVFFLFINLVFFVFDITNNLDIFFTPANLYGFLWQTIFNVSLLAFLFFVFNFVSKKLKSVFY